MGAGEGLCGEVRVVRALAGGLRGLEGLVVDGKVPWAQLLVSSTGGALHAMRADDAGLEVVATAAPRED